MKKMSLLALVFAIVVLPSCYRDKKKESTAQPVKNNTSDKYVKTNIDLDDDVQEVDEIDLDDLNDEDLDIDDIDALLADLEENEENEEVSPSLGEELDMEGDEYSEENQAFTWVDEQLDDELRKLYFTFNHYGIRADQKDSLSYDIEQVKRLVAEAGTAQPIVVIEGHACQEGSPSYNVGLSEKRAKSVADLFVAAGVDKDIIKVIGRGQECPLLVDGKVVNGSREDRAPNRRVEVRVIYT